MNQNKLASHHIRWKFLTILFTIIFLSLSILFIGLILDTFVGDINNEEMILNYDSNQISNRNFNTNINQNQLTGDFYIGNPSATLTIIQYVDYECPFCKKFHKKIYKNIYEDYIIKGDIKYIFKHYPLEFHKNALNAALAQECAREQFVPIEYQELLYNSKNLNRDLLINLAFQTNINSTQFEICLDSQKYLSKINSDILSGEELELTEIPVLIIEDITIEGLKPYSFYKKIIDEKLSK